MTTRALNDLADALVAAAPSLNECERKISRAIYRSIALGEPLSDAELADRTGMSLHEVRSALASWPGVLRDHQARVIGCWGLTLSETPHKIEVDGVELYGWCAWDTLFLPSLLGANVVVRSSDPQSGETITLVVTPTGVTERSHEHAVVSFLTPDHPFDADIVSSFCHFIHFFTDPETAAPWLAAHTRTFLLDLDDAFELGRRWNVARGL